MLNRHLIKIIFTFLVQMCQGLGKYLINNPQLDDNLFNEEAVLKAGM